MSPTELTQLVLALATFVSAVAAVIASLRNHTEIGKVKELVNGQSAAMNALTAKSSFAEGHLAARAEDTTPP